MNMFMSMWLYIYQLEEDITELEGELYDAKGTINDLDMQLDDQN